MKIRGYFALILVFLGVLVADLVQRLVIVPLVRLRPSGREAVLTRWIQAMASLVTRPLATLGGASIPESPGIPSEPGTLVLMNHQSLFDIPLVVRSFKTGYPRIVTRKRYNRRIPLISHMTRLYQYPIVDPTAKTSDGRKMLGGLQEAARTSEVPLALFPEGTRSRNGEIGRFKTTGLNLILKARPWTVYVLVVDGFWERATFWDLWRGVSTIRGHMELAGTFEWTDPEADPRPFVAKLRACMIRGLEEIRGAALV